MKIKDILFNCLLIVLIGMMLVTAYREHQDVEGNHPLHRTFAIDEIKNARQRVSELMCEALIIGSKEKAEQYRKISLELTEIKVRLEEIRDQDKPK